MARWETDGRGRLERAALELFTEQGYDRTTVAQIAQRAGLTERSFYRHYADKREVLFGGGGNELESHLVASVSKAPAELGPLDVILTALASAHELFRPRELLIQGAAVIAANAPLRERQLMKMASMSTALVAALMRRGIDKHTAQLATDLGTSVSRLAAERWLADDTVPFAEHFARSAEQLRRVAAESSRRA
jgi:AcrR family transcriptional regulator